MSVAGSVPVTSYSAPVEPRAREAIVRLEGLSKRFPVRRGWKDSLRRPRGTEWTEVVRDVRCEIRAGECFGLLGPNGAGKTTLFKMLATLVLPDAGTASVGGFDLVRDAAKVRRLLTPVIADERSLYWRISARENLRLFASLHGLHGSAARERIAELLATVELADSAKMVGMFSSGMKQRLLIARALISRPRILLLDEPTRSLDPISARALREFLRTEIAGRQGCTIFLATHSTEEALELCDRVAVLDRGRIRAIGAAATLAAELGEDRHRFWVRGESRAVLASLAAQGIVSNIGSPSIDIDGWVRIEMDIDGGMAANATVVSALARARVSVGRVEPVRLGLADLIERIVARAPDGTATDA
jgi:ABC-2 type transport system ATP-binding protein